MSKAPAMLHAYASVCNAQVDRAKANVQLMIRSDLSRQIAYAVLDKHMETTKDTYTTEYRMSVYVLTASELHQLIADRAARLQHGIPFYES